MATPDELRNKVTRYRILERSVTDQRVLDALSALAGGADEALAVKLEGRFRSRAVINRSDRRSPLMKGRF